MDMSRLQTSLPLFISDFKAKNDGKIGIRQFLKTSDLPS